MMHPGRSPWHGSLNIRQLQKYIGSPLWIVSGEELAERVQAFTKFTGHPSRILYPIKANPAPVVVQRLAALGCGADCANGSEIRLALLAGVPMAHIAYNSPLQEVSTCLRVLRAGGTVVLDDPSVIAELQVHARRDRFPGKVWLRINPLERRDYATAAGSQELMSHGSSSSKFGIPVERLEQVLKDHDLTISGLHLHVGTQMDHTEAFRVALKALYEAAGQAIALGHPVESLDIGGGLGIPFSDEARFPSIGEWCDALSPMKDDRFQHYAEPGHALVGPAVGLLSTVRSIKDSRGRRWAVCDVGTDQLAKVTLLHWPHRVFGPDGEQLPSTGDDALAGPLCFAGDTLLPHTDLGDIRAGDPILIADAGAYTHSLSNGFNGRTAPAWALAEGQEVHLVTDREMNHTRLFFQHHDWSASRHQGPVEELHPEMVHDLQSPYLHRGASEDNYRFTRVERTAPRKYGFRASASSPAGFVSMPFATRIMGDAAIVALLHELGRQTKDTAVWGERLELEYFAMIPTSDDLAFDVMLSHVVQDRQGLMAAVTFATTCRKLRGSLMVRC